MFLEIDLLHSGGSNKFFHASGRRRPDSYRFEKVKGQEHIHRLIIPGDKIEDTLEDLGLRLQQADIPVLIKVVLEDGDRDGSDRLTTLAQELQNAYGDVGRLERELEAARKTKGVPKAETGKQRITDEQVTMLAERDELLILLVPFAEGEDTPIDVLKRVTEAYSRLAPDQEARRVELSKLGKKTLRKKITEMKLTVETDANIAAMVQAILEAEAKQE